MRTFRNIAAILGVLLLLYVGAYWRFARTGMRSGYRLCGSGYSRVVKWSDWRKFFVPVAALDFRMNVELPLKKSCAGHWRTEKSDDFVTLYPDGKCSFRLGEFQHTGNMEIGTVGAYGMKFTQGGKTYFFRFRTREQLGKVTAGAFVQEKFIHNGFPDMFDHASAYPTRVPATD